METTLKHVYNPAQTNSLKKNPISRFISWADNQQEKSLLWSAISIAGHGCVFTILTVMTILLTGNHFIFWPFAIGAMTMCVIVNLAALPTKITIPILFFSLLIDVVIIGMCIANVVGNTANNL